MFIVEESAEIPEISTVSVECRRNHIVGGREWTKFLGTDSRMLASFAAEIIICYNLQTSIFHCLRCTRLRGRFFIWPRADLRCFWEGLKQ